MHFFRLFLLTYSVRGIRGGEGKKEKSVIKGAGTIFTRTRNSYSLFFPD